MRASQRLSVGATFSGASSYLFSMSFRYLIDLLFMAGHRCVQSTLPTHPPLGKTLLALKEMPVTVNRTKPREVQLVLVLFCSSLACTQHHFHVDSVSRFLQCFSIFGAVPHEKISGVHDKKLAQTPQTFALECGWCSRQQFCADKSSCLTVMEKRKH